MKVGAALLLLVLLVVLLCGAFMVDTVLVLSGQPSVIVKGDFDNVGPLGLIVILVLGTIVIGWFLFVIFPWGISKFRSGNAYNL